MKEIKIIVDGNEITAQISEENLNALLPKPKRTGFERAREGEDFWHIGISSEVPICQKELNTGIDFDLWDMGNYYSDREVAQWCGEADLLMRRIRRFAAFRNVDEKNNGYGFILTRCEDRQFRALRVEDVHRVPFTPVFYTYEIAKEAIDLFGYELEKIYNACPSCIFIQS